MKITVFTLVLGKTKPLHDFCMSTWHRIVDYFNKQNIECEIKIYNESDDEYQYIKNNIIKPKRYDKVAYMADVFRLYILSNKPYHLWLDWDVFIRDNFELNWTKSYFHRSWWLLYNASNLNLFRTIYKEIIENDLNELCDSKITDLIVNKYKNDFMLFKSNQDENDMRRRTVHLKFIDNFQEKKWVFIKGVKEICKYVNEKHNSNIVLIYPPGLSVFLSYIYGFNGEKEIIQFVLNNYNLSIEQKNILNSYLKN